ncbi:MAG: FixH family protein [Cytophagaceae bacterium]|nr:FixH family protein [Cytophagaceae bacterium]
MNWGKSIVLVFIVFAGFIGFMIYRMCRQRVDLVRDDYYQTEIAYQQQINRLVNASQKKPLDMTYHADVQQIAFVLPTTLHRGVIYFYRPSDRAQDFNLRIPDIHPARQVVSTAKLARGFWRVQLTWSDGQRDYYTEQDVYL